MIYSPNQESKIESGTITIKNPSDIEFKTSYLDDKNKTVEVILKPQESKSFPIHGQTILTHLATFLLNRSNFNYKTDTKLELERIKTLCIIR